MLQEKNKKLETWAFDVDVEFDETTISPEKVAMKMADALSWVEGVGKVNINIIERGATHVRHMIELTKEGKK